jgi:hypothetical protein
MRAYPWSVFKSDAFAIEDCKLSNPHPENIKVSQAYHKMLRQALLDQPIEEPSWMFPGVFEEEVNSEKKGWVHVAFECVRRTYKMTLPDAFNTLAPYAGDIDTNFAIAGAVVGARLGFKPIFLFTVINFPTVLKVYR